MGIIFNRLLNHTNNFTLHTIGASQGETDMDIKSITREAEMLKVIAVYSLQLAIYRTKMLCNHESGDMLAYYTKEVDDLQEFLKELGHNNFEKMMQYK